ncbi:hypothetical protein G9A89_010271 [Geosiphon pyriformis]|nr:hypothetical protein G9A89_010271 [Geosiphon pyriformis]
MAYTPIAKLNNFTGEEDDTQVWLNDVEKAIAINGWNDARAMQAILYFFKNTANSCSILQHIRLLYPGTLQDTVTCARDFESAESEANHVQAINLVMNKSSELNFKLEKFRETINQKIEEYLVNNNQNQPHLSSLTNQQWQQETYICHYCAINLSAISISNSNLLTAASTNLPAVVISNISTAVTNNLLTSTNSNAKSVMVIHQPIPNSSYQLTESHSRNSNTSSNQNPNSQHYLSLLVIPKNTTTNNPEPNQQTTLINNIPPVTITNDKLLATIFSFELKETTTVPLFSGAALKKKSIMAMYTDVKVDKHSIKLILDSRSAGSIITKQLMDQLGHRVDCTASARIITANGATKTPIGEIDNLLIEVNGIIIPIKALVGNNWLSKASTIIDWNTQKVQLSQHNQHTRAPAICGHFKSNYHTTPLIELEEEKPKPTWKAYQVSWANNDHNELLPILAWDDNDNRKEKQKKEHTWGTTINIWTDNN